MASSSPQLNPSYGIGNTNGCESDDDDLYYFPERDMTEEEEIEYFLAFEKSEGFDMPDFSDSYAEGRIEPITGSRLYSQELQDCAERAISYYNNQNGTSFEFVKMVKATNQAVTGILYYITFQVKQMGTPPNSPTKTFQARVLSGIPEEDDDDDDCFVVELCRLEPSTST